MDNLYFNPKRLRKIRNKRNCRGMKIWGWILTGIGGITFLDTLVSLASYGNVGNLLDSLLFLIPGAILLWMARKKVKRWDQYEALIDKKGNTSIKMLAERMKLSEQTVYSDLQTMINNDFFIGPNYNVEAYVDGERDLLVMTVAGKPLKPIPQASAEAKKPEQAEPTQRPSEGNWQDDESVPEAEWKQEPVIKVKMTDLEMIQKAIAETPREDVRNSLYGIEGSLRRIDGRVQEDPNLKKKGSIRNLYRYYLPQIMELIEEYQSPDVPEDIKDEIRKALHTSAEALANIEADIIEKEQMDIEVDIQVLKNMFAQDGLLRQNLNAGEKATQPRPQPQAQARPQPQVQQRR